PDRLVRLRRVAASQVGPQGVQLQRRRPFGGAGQVPGQDRGVGTPGSQEPAVAGEGPRADRPGGPGERRPRLAGGPPPRHDGGPAPPPGTGVGRAGGKASGVTGSRGSSGRRTSWPVAGSHRPVVPRQPPTASSRPSGAKAMGYVV